MNELTCPYCKKDVRPSDDLREQEEDYEHECEHCGKTFVYYIQYFPSYHASQAIVFPWLVETGYSHAPDNRSTDSLAPASTQTTRQTIGIVVPSFIAEMHGTSKAAPITDPLMCMTSTGSHHALLNADAFMTYYYGTQQASGINEPIHTMTGIDRAGLVGALSKLTIEDLTFRMLRSHEIGKAMAFPGSYVVLGTQREKVKQYGNAVTPPVMEMLLNRCIEALQ